MKKLAALLMLFVLCSVAFALPSPHQIEDALAARDYVSARGMVQQVLSERPDSARAHLLNAFLLEHVDHNLGAARAELQTASGLDKRGDVKGSALFGRVVAEMDAQPAVRAVARPAAVAPAAVAPAPVPAAPPFPWAKFFLILVLIVLVVALVIMLTRREGSVTTVYVDRRGGRRNPGVRYPSPDQPSGGSPGYAHTPVYEPAFGQTIIQSAPAHTGMTAGENFMSTAGGVVAGNVISDALFHDRHRRDDDDYERRRRRDESSVESASVYTAPPAFDSTPAVDYASERSSFSSSSSGSDSWGSSSSSSSDYSSSSSSSSDWGSSSSSDSGSSSDW
jgi:uncharacterized membrane protein YgcG